MRLAIVTLALSLCAQAVSAESQYFIAPRMSVLTTGDSNLLLGSRSPIETGNANTSLSFDLNRQSLGWKSDLIPRVNLRRFFVNSAFDADEYGVNFNNDWTGESVSVGLDVGYTSDSTLITEATDTGASNDVVGRDSIEVTPSLTWQMSERWQTQFSLLFNDISYASGTSGLLGYRYVMGSSTASYTYNDTTQIFTTFFTSDFDVPEIGNHTRTYGTQLGMTKFLTPTIRVTGSAGYVWSTIDSLERRLGVVDAPPPPHIGIIDVPVSANATGPIANFSVQKQLSTVSLAKFDYSRQLSPGGRGTQTISDNMTLRADLKLRPDWLLILSGSHDMRTSEGGLFANDTDRDFTTLRGALRYAWTREWWVTGAYRFAFRQNTGLSTDFASGHAVSLTIEYNGLTRPISLLNGL